MTDRQAIERLCEIVSKLTMGAPARDQLNQLRFELKQETLCNCPTLTPYHYLHNANQPTGEKVCDCCGRPRG